MRPDQELIIATAKLHKAAGLDFVDFIKALERFADFARDQMVEATSDKIFLAQGRAKALRDLVTTLAEASQRADAVRTRLVEKR